jgi:DNA-directed RNA polymerase specialized sigma24 family protein
VTKGRLDADAERLLRDLVPQVLGAVVRRFHDSAAAEDAVQEAWLRQCSNGRTKDFRNTRVPG